MTDRVDTNVQQLVWAKDVDTGTNHCVECDMPQGGPHESWCVLGTVNNALLQVLADLGVAEAQLLKWESVYGKWPGGPAIVAAALARPVCDCGRRMICTTCDNED